ncbi:MAG: pyruvate carboxyltransferase [Phycisphaerae bacterium]|nr:pyruvate carboxyltransferase [Phycisphaerae bacterium]
MFSAINRQIKRMVLRQQKARPIVRISDTTLRDGAQTPGIRLTVDSRLTIARALADAGVHSIDCGFAASSPTDVEAMKRISKTVKGPILSGLSRCRKDDIDATYAALSGASPLKRAISLFCGTSPLHREHRHNMSKAQIIDMICKAIDHAHTRFEIISFGAEDASRTEPDFLCEVYNKAIEAGAMSIGFADTVGLLTPPKAVNTVRRIQDGVKRMDDAMLAVHFHNDLGLATANSLACIEAGCNIVQGTINGIGERAGNTALEEVVLTLELHQDQYKRGHGMDTTKLASLSRLVAELTGFGIADNKAVVGRNLFRTEAGIHQDAMLKHTDTYMPFPPELIGADPVELVLGPTSGRSAVKHYLEQTGVEAKDEYVDFVLGYLKNGQHAPSDRPEVQQFLDRLRPYMGEALPNNAEELTRELERAADAARKNGVAHANGVHS